MNDKYTAIVFRLIKFAKQNVELLHEDPDNAITKRREEMFYFFHSTRKMIAKACL